MRIWHWLRGFLDDIWHARPIEEPTVTWAVEFSADLIPPLDFAPEVRMYREGRHTWVFRSYEPWTEKSRKALDDFEDEVMRRMFRQAVFAAHWRG
jgi:hypothetical protein